MISTKVLILIAAVIFQHCVFPSEAAYLQKPSGSREHVSKQQEPPTPEDLMKEFEDLVTELVKDAHARINSTEEDADNEVPKLEVDYKNQLDGKYGEFNEKLGDLKAQADIAGVNVTDCIEGAKQPIDDAFKKNSEVLVRCDFDHTSNVSLYTVLGHRNVESMLNHVQRFRNNLETCGTNVFCRINFSIDIAIAIAKTPAIIEGYVQETYDGISVETMKQCLSNPVNVFTKYGQISIDIAFRCVQQRIHDNYAKSKLA